MFVTSILGFILFLIKKDKSIYLTGSIAIFLIAMAIYIFTRCCFKDITIVIISYLFTIIFFIEKRSLLISNKIKLEDDDDYTFNEGFKLATIFWFISYVITSCNWKTKTVFLLTF